MKRLILIIAPLFFLNEATAQSRVFNFDGVGVQAEFRLDSSLIDVMIFNYKSEAILVSGRGVVNLGQSISAYPDSWVLELGSFFVSFDNMHGDFYLKELKSLDSLRYSIKLDDRIPLKKLVVSFDYFDMSLLKRSKKKGARKITFDPVRGVYSGDKFAEFKRAHSFFYQEE